MAPFFRSTPAQPGEVFRPAAAPDSDTQSSSAFSTVTHANPLVPCIDFEATHRHRTFESSKFESQDQDVFKFTPSSDQTTDVPEAQQPPPRGPAVPSAAAAARQAPALDEKVEVLGRAGSAASAPARIGAGKTEQTKEKEKGGENPPVVRGAGGEGPPGFGGWGARTPQMEGVWWGESALPEEVVPKAL